MTDKTFRQLTGASSLGTSDLFAIENAAGNSRKITASRVRQMMIAPATAALDAHEDDTEAHGISAYMATLMGSANLAALLAALDFEITGTSTSGKFSFGGLFVITWREMALSGTSSGVKPYGSDHAYSSWAQSWVEGDDGTEGISVWVTSSGTSGATVNWALDSGQTIRLFSIGV